MLTEDGVASPETIADETEMMLLHTRELQFRIESMWRQFNDLITQPNGKRLAGKLLEDISICENHLHSLGAAPW